MDKIQQLLIDLGLNIELTPTIITAFTHTSYVNEHKEYDIEDNERLEFLGDAVLELWVSNYLFSLPEKLSEGDMTTTRARLVCEQSLAQYARDLNLGECLLLGFGEEKNDGRNRDSILANTFEAFLGALYLSIDYHSIENLLKKVVVVYIENPDKKVEGLIDYKTMLQEFIQADTRQSVKYEVTQVEGPSNAPIFYVNVKLENIVLGSGVGTSKKRAEQKAAEDAFLKLAR